MFAVQGWSLPPDSLKTEQPSEKPGPAGAKSRKRKRAAGAKDVTADNVADLYSTVVEGKPAPDAKRPKRASEKKPSRAHEGKGAPSEEKVKEDLESKGAGERVKKGKKDKEEKDKKHEKNGKKDKREKKNPEDGEPASEQVAAVVKAPALTPLQASMREKLISARFRHLNETLYTAPSTESYTLFQENPEMFDEYHEGFRRQVKVWPENPVNSFLSDIRARAKIRFPAQPARLASTPLPRTAGTCVIADLGCGDARLAESLQAEPKARLDVRSYDLQSPSPLVTKADIANLPLEDGAVNVAIFCLALMGTNWPDFIEEAYRILHWKGELWVAEIKSRFGPVRSKHAPVTHSVGNRRKPTKVESAARDAETKRLDQDLAVEVDGADDTRRETDVSAFVEALRKRGFVLHGEREAVDLSNKMFVKMRFLKAAAPSVGKNAKGNEEGPAKKKMWQYGKDDAKEREVDEAAILKPCVYKIR